MGCMGFRVYAISVFISWITLLDSGSLATNRHSRFKSWFRASS